MVRARGARMRIMALAQSARRPSPWRGASLRRIHANDPRTVDRVEVRKHLCIHGVRRGSRSENYGKQERGIGIQAESRRLGPLG